MLGTKIRSWMEAHIVRPRKKQHRKDVVNKKRNEYENGKENLGSTDQDSPAFVKEHLSKSDGCSKKESNSEQVRTSYPRNNNTNLSSPESAYSTGYSTDGTSPGTSFPTVPAVPEYYINIRTGTRYFHSSSSDSVPLRVVLPGASHQHQENRYASVALAEPSTIMGRVPSPAVTSPRQRNRIRTNPWLITANLACNCSPVHANLSSRQLLPVVAKSGSITGSRPIAHATTASPIRRKWTCTDKKQRCMKCGVCSRFEAFSSSSSSSSSLSVKSVHKAATRTSIGSDDEDDRTLNEMMGKYDESYVYEKETDILSDSDPTDCDEDYDDTDAEAGREGGDERDPLTDEDDFDFIDNGSLELNNECNGVVNMGNCTYHNFQEDRRDVSKAAGWRRTCSGTPAVARRKRSERRSRHASSKKRRERHVSSTAFIDHHITARARCLPAAYTDGSRSAGATPLSIRRRKAALSEQSSWLSRSIDKQRHYSMSHTRRPRIPLETLMHELDLDKEADKKYKELIIEAEHILMAMRTSSPPVNNSPARRTTLAPTNKRVELLRNEECGSGGGGVVSGNGATGVGSSIDTFKSNCIGAADISAKFSPKKNHITKFMKTAGSYNGVVKTQTSLMSPRRGVSPMFSLKAACPQSEPVKRKIYAPVETAAESGQTRPTPFLMFLETAPTPITHTDTKTHKLLHSLTSLKRTHHY